MAIVPCPSDAVFFLMTMKRAFTRTNHYTTRWLKSKYAITIFARI